MTEMTTMRRYDRNSPQAAARIVALTVLADGDFGAAELGLLDEIAAHRTLGLEREALHAVIDEFCEDLLSSKQLAWADACPVDEYTLASLMDDIDEPELRRKVLGLCLRLAGVDDLVADGALAPEPSRPTFAGIPIDASDGLSQRRQPLHRRLQLGKADLVRAGKLLVAQ